MACRAVTIIAVLTPVVACVEVAAQNDTAPPFEVAARLLFPNTDEGPIPFFTGSEMAGYPAEERSINSIYVGIITCCFQPICLKKMPC